ncbi:MAG: peptide ABC transporter substrate-binding protein [Chloroflexota bacterium]|nr:peptide ABC transporter substrate-binding protein [Chloroflexota bacterium]
MSRFRRSLLKYLLIMALLISSLPFVTGCEGSSDALRINLGGNPTTLDPQKAGAARDLSLVIQLFDGLLGFNQDLSLKPVVATEVPSTLNGGISKDGLTYTFNLRDDVTWSDEEPVTAQHFVYSIRRLFHSDTKAPYRSLFYDIANAKTYRKGEASADDIGVEAIDDYTLRITLGNPCNSFLQRMALWAVYPLRQDIVEGNGDEWDKSTESCIGNGPFLLQEWVTDDHITLEKNPNYWGEKAMLDEVRYSMYEDAATEYIAYKTGDLDIARVPLGTEGTMADNPELISYPRLKTNAVFFDCAEPPFDNSTLRKALSTAIDRDALVNSVQGGRGSITYSWIPAGMPGYENDYNQTAGDEFAFDSEQAQDLLAEAGYAEGKGLPDIRLVYSNVGSNPTIAQFIQGQLEDNLGISIDVVGVGQAVYWDRVFEEHDEWDLAYISFSSDYPAPDNWLPDFFATTGAYNAGIAQYSNPVFDNTVASALAEPDDDVRLDLWQEAEAIMVQDAPAIFMFNDEMYALKKTSVKGVVSTAMDLYFPGDLFLSQIELS